MDMNESKVTGRDNVVIGSNNTVAHDNCIVIGHGITTTSDNQVLIGNGNVLVWRNLQEDETAQIKASLLNALAGRGARASAMSEDGLLACPFCGSIDISSGEVCAIKTEGINGDEFITVQTACLACGGSGPEIKCETNGPDANEAADAAWNRRV